MKLFLHMVFDYLRTCMEMSGWCTSLEMSGVFWTGKLFFTTSVTLYVSEKGITVCILPIFGRARNVSSFQRPATKNFKSTCFFNVTRTPFTVWSFNSGAGISRSMVSMCAIIILQSSDSDNAFWTALVSDSALVLYVLLTQKSTAKHFCFFLSCNVGLRALKFIGIRFSALFLDFKSQVIVWFFVRWQPMKIVVFVFVSSAVLNRRWLVIISSSVVPDCWIVMSSLISFSTKASFLLIVFGFWPSFHSGCCLLASCRPVVWRLLGGIIGACYFRWWWSLSVASIFCCLFIQLSGTFCFVEEKTEQV